MRLLKKQPGLPFLLALGVLLILSASFLAVQLWSDKSFRGAAEALEAPMMPPPLPTARKGESKAMLEKRIEMAKAAAEVEVVDAPEVQESEKVAEPVAPKELERPTKPAVQANEPMTDAAPAKAKEVPVKFKEAPAAGKEASLKIKEAPARAMEIKPVDPVFVKEAAAAAKTQKEPVATTSAYEEAVPAVLVERGVAPVVTKTEKPAKTVAASVRRSIRARKEVVETEVPPEWDWFSTPLKMEVSGGNVELVPSEKVREVRFINVVATLPVEKKETVVRSVDEVSTSSVVSPMDTAMPFTSALARMAKLRYSRKATAKTSSETANAGADYRSPSLEKLQQVVAHLRSRLDDRKVRVVKDVADASVVATDVVSRDYVEVAPAQALEVSVDDASAGSGEVDVAEHRFKPYYGGSGTALSTRINDLLQRGVGYRR